MFGLLLGSLGFAQVPDVRTPPERIQFEPWQQLRRSESYSEFKATFPSSISSGDARNDQVELFITVPTESIGKPPIVILLHFWGASDMELELQMAKELASRDIASVIMPLPYHLSRTPEGKRSGELAILPDPVRLKTTMTQSVADIRRTIDYLETRTELDATRIGVTGTSLGAIVSGLAFAVEPRIDAATFLLGGADLAEILMSSSRTIAQRRELERSGWTAESLRQELSAIEPLNYLSKTDTRPSYLITAKHDTVVPTLPSDKLRDALGNVESLVLDTGHYGGFLVKDRLLRSASAFFDAVLRGRTFYAPDKFYSPTVRFAILADIESGLQVGAGLDIWRSDSNADAYLAAFLTPKGPRAYLGFHLGNGVSIGAMFSRTGPSPGLVWSTIF